MTPLPILVAGIALGVLGALLTFMGIDLDMTGVLAAGWAATALAGLATFVGLVSWSVEIGVRAAER